MDVYSLVTLYGVDRPPPTRMDALAEDRYYARHAEHPHPNHRLLGALLTICWLLIGGPRA